MNDQPILQPLNRSVFIFTPSGSHGKNLFQAASRVIIEHLGPIAREVAAGHVSTNITTVYNTTIRLRHIQDLDPYRFIGFRDFFIVDLYSGKQWSKQDYDTLRMAAQTRSLIGEHKSLFGLPLITFKQLGINI